jgi:hypothetical protein
MASAQFGTDRTLEALSRARREGKTDTKAATSSARRGALPMCDVAAYVKYHITRIGACDTMVKIARTRTFDDRLLHQRTVPLRFVCGHRRSDRQLQHGGVLTFA